MINAPKIEVKLGRRPGSLTILVDGKPCAHRDRNRLIRKWAYEQVVEKEAIAHFLPLELIMGDPDVD
jgi:hypothetical protein